MADSGSEEDDHAVDACLALRVAGHPANPSRRAAVKARAKGPARSQNPSTRQMARQLARADKRVVDSRVAVLDDRDSNKRKVTELLEKVDGVLFFKDPAGGKRAPITFKSAMRVALAPTHLGISTLQATIFSGGIGIMGVARCRLRVAQCLRVLYQARLGVRTQEFTQEAAESSCRPTRRHVARGPLAIEDRREPREASDDDGDDFMAAVLEAPWDLSAKAAEAEQALVLAGPSSTEELGIAAVGGVMWKWDGKQVPAYVKERLRDTELGAVLEEGAEEIWTGGKGADCFVQRGALVTLNLDHGRPKKVPVPVPPKPLGDKNAAGILEASEFEEIVDNVIQTLRRLSLGYGFENAKRIGRLFFPRIVLVLCICVDAASVNLAAVRQIMNRFDEINKSNQSGLTIVVVLRLCVAHQVHICGRTVFSCLGASLGAQTFLSGLTKSCHVFGNSAYIVRIMKVALRTLASCCILTPLEAAARGIERASPEEVHFREVLMLYLLRWTKQQAKEFASDSKVAKAVRLLTRFFNFKWTYAAIAGPREFYHICDGVTCFCRRLRHRVTSVTKAWQVVMNGTPMIFSEGRWAAASPAFAYFALWNLFGMLGSIAINGAFARDRLEMAAAAPGEPGSNDEWKADACKRILASMKFVGAPSNVIACITGVICNEPCQICLFRVFKSESKSHPEMARFVHRQGLGLARDDAERGEGQGEADANAEDARPQAAAPACVRLASGEFVLPELRRCHSILAEDNADLAPHVLAFRELFWPGAFNDSAKNIIRGVWQCLLPGAAQLWYRLYVLSSMTFPFILLNLISPWASDTFKREAWHLVSCSLQCCT